MTIKIIMDKFPESRTSTHALMEHSDTTDLNIRILNSVTSSSIIGVVLEETHDSFLVALPSKLMAFENQRMIEPHMPVKFARVMKSSVITVIPCYGEFEVFYIKYLLTDGKEQYPELLSVNNFEARLQGRFEQIKQALDKKEVPKEVPKEPEEPASDSIVMPIGPNKYKH